MDLTFWELMSTLQKCNSTLTISHLLLLAFTISPDRSLRCDTISCVPSVSNSLHVITHSTRRAHNDVNPFLSAGCRPLLPVTWPELVRHYLEDNQVTPPFVEAREALDALKQSNYAALSGAHRLMLLEALIHAVTDTEIVRKCAPQAFHASSHVLSCFRTCLSYLRPIEAGCFS